MRTQVLPICLFFLLLPVFGHGYSDVLAANIICEDIYPVHSCTESVECVLLFMECECVPRALRESLDENDPDQKQSLCLYVDFMLELGSPTCCSAQKRALISFEENTIGTNRINHGDQTGIQQVSNQAPTSATGEFIKRTGELWNQNEEIKARVQTLFNSAQWNKEQNEITNTLQRETNYRDDEILQNLYKYLRQYIMRKKKKINTSLEGSVFK